MAGGEGGIEPFRLASLSIDLDELHLHRRVHGLPPSGAARVVYEKAVPRAARFAERHGIPLTFFAVSEDLADDASAASLRLAAGKLHLVESHSATHPYDLVRRSRDEIRAEVRSSFDAIELRVGRRPVGFRAPGYTLSDHVLDALEGEGALFDSSVFPSPPYYLAKLGVLAWMGLHRRSSESIVGSPRVAFAETQPYRPGVHWWQVGRRNLVELPIQVTLGPRLPVTGTTLMLSGRRATWLVRACGKPRFANIALHAIDFLDVNDGLEDLVRFEPVLRVQRDARVRSLSTAVRAFQRDGYVFTTLSAAADALLGGEPRRSRSG